MANGDNTSFLRDEYICQLYEKYLNKIPTREKHPHRNLIFSYTDAERYKIDEAVTLITIKTGLSKREVIQLLVKAGHREIENMAGYGFDYYMAISDMEKDG